MDAEANAQAPIDLPPRTAMTLVNQSPVNSVVVANLLQDQAQSFASADLTVPIEQTQPVPE